MNFSDRLTLLRKEKGLTQAELAKLIGVKRSTIAGYEASGTLASSDKLEALADFFSVSVDYLLGRTDIPDSQSNELDELAEFLKDKNMRVMFSNYENWTKEEKLALLTHLKGQEALREKKEK